MSRIDEIKESLLTAKEWAMAVGYTPDSHEFIESVEYLLSKLEIADKYLQEIVNRVPQNLGEKYSAPVYRHLAIKALEQIRKD